MAFTDTKHNQSVGKALKIVEIMAATPQAMRLTDIAAKVEMPTSTTLRMITTLMENGYIARDGNSQKYYLTLKFARIGNMAAARYSVRDIAHHHLTRLSYTYGEASCLAIDDEMAALYIDVVDGPDGMLKIMQHIGKLSPLHCSGVGKCLLLNYDNDMLDTYIEHKGLPAYTPHTIVEKQQLIQELQQIRAQGYAIDNEECELGARCIACGIKDYGGKIVAAISISGPSNRMTDQHIKAISQPLLNAAAEISELL